MDTKLTSSQARQQAQNLSRCTPLLERVEILDARLAELKTEAATTKGLLPRKELAARLTAMLRANLAAFEQRGPRETRALTVLELLQNLSGAQPQALEKRAVTPTDILALVLFLFGDQLEKSVTTALARVQFESGLGSKERTELAAKLAAERASLVAERRTLVCTLADSGVVLDHLPETVRDLQIEAAQAKVAQEQQGYQAGRERRLEDLYAKERAEGDNTTF